MKADPIRPGCNQAPQGRPKIGTIKLDRMPFLLSMAWAMKASATAQGMSIAQWRRAAYEAALRGASPES